MTAYRAERRLTASSASKAPDRPNAASPRRIVGLLTALADGGATHALMRLKRLLMQRGYEMEVWGFYRKTQAFDREPGVRALLETDKPGTLGYLKITLRLFKELRRHRPDAVIAFMPLGCVLGSVAARFAGVRCRVVSQRGPARFLSWPMRVADVVVGSLGFYSVNVAVSQGVIDDVRHYPRRYRERLYRVYNGIEWRGSGLSKATARKRYGLPGGAMLAVAVGRLHEQKNYPFLLRVAAGTPEIRLVIAGDGPLRGHLEALAENLGVASRTDFLGLVPKDEIADLLRASDLFVQPSLYEGQSNALLEAMCEGLPILASDIPPSVETLRDPDGSVAGLVLPLDDEEAWRRAIQDLVKDQDRRRDLGRAAMRRATHFTPARMADGFEAALLGRMTDRYDNGDVPSS